MKSPIVRTRWARQDDNNDNGNGNLSSVDGHQDAIILHAELALDGDAERLLV